ncbi:chromosome segregation protein [Bifidobacterium commune]|uniref:Chromosome partition protein Smc n=1 Tax=Bifidobacterium commune TaxID=1505727 RepID=A0A1C4H054_9BIFI|nr:AAA family ATPase [Bifidobacterium commune]MBB2955162.1 chromosome segregation protein [Bifidobacterium commune]SCC78259.1 condensin subunit Smc [Bifidobacterium commune]
MYLKELTLRGFKSFASATTLRFEPGITAVVGPNGSGKSNIVDALTWVMGEQGAKNLRGTSMEDVIFAGTSSRSPLGRAQVSLTIDNTDGTLDIDYTEVTISRTIYRNGGSEYAINGSSCRLLDIQELLSDTGLGQQMHVIVGQGRLDEILKADPAGHRAFIEEAAGILKHRKRKERALRKLKNTEANLARTDDLLHEIRRQLGPLGRQAKISRRAASIQISLRDAQSRIFAEDAQRSMESRAKLRADLAEVRRELETEQRELSKIKMCIEQVEALSSESNPAINKINETWRQLSSLEERFGSLASLADERARSLAGQIITNFGEDPDLLESRAKELEEQAEAQKKAVSDLRLAYDKATENRAGDEKQLAAARQTLTELRKVAQEHTSKIANLRDLKTREESAIELAQSRAKDFKGQRDALLEQRDKATTEHETLALQSRNADEQDGTDELEAAKTAMHQRQEELDALQEQLRATNAKITALKAKADALKETLESRNASGDLERDAEVDALGRLADFIHIESGWEEAVAHALDQFASAIVVPDRSNMVKALNHAEEGKLGQAVVLHPVEGTGNIGSGDSTRDKEDPIRRAASLVSLNNSVEDSDFATRVVDAVRVLLDDVAAVPDMETALKTVEGSQFSQAVTKAGEVVNPVGAIGGSSRSQSDLSLVARRDKAMEEAEKLEAEISALSSRIDVAQAARDEARIEVDRQSQQRMRAKVKADQIRKDLNAAEDRIKQLSRQIETLDDRIKQTADDRQTHQLKLEDLTQALEAAERSDTEHQDFDDLAERVRSLETSLDQAREQEVSAKIVWNDASRKADSLVRQAGLLHDQASEAVGRRARMQQLNEKRERRQAHDRQIAADARGMARLVACELASVVAKRDELSKAALSHDAQLKELRARRDEVEPNVAMLQRREHELDINRERLAAQYGQIEQKVSDTLGMGLDALVDEYGPDNPVPVLDDEGCPIPLERGGKSAVVDDAGVGNNAGIADTADLTVGGTAAGNDTSQTPQIVVMSGKDDLTDTSDDSNADGYHTGEQQVAIDTERYQTVPYVRVEQEKRLQKAERDLKALGKINPLAAEEFDALEARNQYLNDQRNDVAASRDDLLKLIKDLDRTMIEVFKSAFDDTAAAFETVFATLFPGGKGRLRLEDPDDLLTTGIIVEASPAGKRVKQLSLLSGGERSLTALALLFAIFTARPSPFYVMDEVEAALDDINLTRLLNAFNDLRKHAQLIIITHQQRTMAIADALYGVTMRSDGVTAVVSQKLEHE